MSELTNRIGLTRKEYTGLPSTMCKGCGHDSITSCIIAACYELGVDPAKVAKLSGIGCSSKTPAYFLARSFGFNAVHGRMPSIATGTELANHALKLIGVSGDGDSANIGIGQFVHGIRRNINLIYIIENNGTYGLTKGQFSATSDFQAVSHYGDVNESQPLDIVQLAIELGATFVARSFSGDKQQLTTLIKAAFSHKGCAVLDVISPCVTFNNHEESTKSYTYVKEHDIPMQELGFIPSFEEITIDYKPGEAKEVELHDGSHLILKKLKEDYDPTNKMEALMALEKSFKEKNIITGLIYYRKDLKPLHELMNLPDRPFHEFTENELRPTREQFEEFMNELK